MHDFLQIVYIVLHYNNSIVYRDFYVAFGPLLPNKLID